MNEDILEPTSPTMANSGPPASPEQVLDMTPASYVGLHMEDAEEALAVLEEHVKPILTKLDECRMAEAGAAWIKSQECNILLEWIVTMLNHSQLLTVKLTASEQVMGQMDAKIKRLNDGKGLCTPGGDAPELSTP